MPDEQLRGKNCWFYCDICEYKCKKEVTLDKHKNTKHVVQSCTQCNVKCLTVIDLLKHISTEHVEEESESDHNVNVVQQTQENEIINKDIRSKCKNCKVVLTEEDNVKNHVKKTMCMLCIYALVLNM